MWRCGCWNMVLFSSYFSLFHSLSQVKKENKFAIVSLDWPHLWNVFSDVQIGIGLNSRLITKRH
jgi:hypothetical protein